MDKNIAVFQYDRETDLESILAMLDRMHEVTKSGVRVRWLKEESSIHIMWDDGCEDKVDAVLDCLDGGFNVTGYMVHNGVETIEEIHEAPKFPEQEIFKEPNTEDSSSAKVIESEEILEEESQKEILRDKNPEEAEVPDVLCVASELMDEAKSEEAKLSNDANIMEGETTEPLEPSDDIPIEKTDDAEETTEISESTSSENLEEVGLAVEEVPLKEEVEPPKKVQKKEKKIPPEVPKDDFTAEDYEKILQERCAIIPAMYDFKNDIVGSVTTFCKDYKIHSELLSVAIVFARRGNSMEDMLKKMQKKFCKNTALIRAELSKTFRKWLETNYKEVAEEYHNLNVAHFLNIFRKEHS